MKSGYSIRYSATIRLLLITLSIILLQPAAAQQTRSSGASAIIKQLRSGITDTPRVKLLLQLSTFYLNKTLNPTHDRDSALVIAGEALDLAKGL